MYQAPTFSLSWCSCCSSVFFDISDNTERLERIHGFWWTEIKLSDHNVPIILVGSKLDLRDKDEITTISVEEGIALAAKIGAKEYMEISCLENRGLSDLFGKALKIGYRHSLDAKKNLRGKTVNNKCFMI